MFNLNLVRDASTYFEVLNLLRPSMLLNLVNLADLDLPVLNLAMYTHACMCPRTQVQLYCRIRKTNILNTLDLVFGNFTWVDLVESTA